MVQPRFRTEQGLNVDAARRALDQGLITPVQFYTLTGLTMPVPEAQANLQAGRITPRQFEELTGRRGTGFGEGFEGIGQSLGLVGQAGQSRLEQAARASATIAAIFGGARAAGVRAPSRIPSPVRVSVGPGGAAATLTPGAQRVARVAVPAAGVGALGALGLSRAGREIEPPGAPAGPPRPQPSPAPTPTTAGVTAEEALAALNNPPQAPTTAPAEQPPYRVIDIEGRKFVSFLEPDELGGVSYSPYSPLRDLPGQTDQFAREREIAGLPEGERLRLIAAAARDPARFRETAQFFGIPETGLTSFPGTQASPGLAEIFGLTPGQELPVPGALVRGDKKAPGVEDPFERAPVSPDTRVAAPALQAVPTPGAIEALPARERNVLGELFDIYGLDTEDVLTQGAQLAPPAPRRRARTVR